MVMQRFPGCCQKKHTSEREKLSLWSNVADD
jgi:hypothetical protein